MTCQHIGAVQSNSSRIWKNQGHFLFYHVMSDVSDLCCCLACSALCGAVCASASESNNNNQYQRHQTYYNVQPVHVAPQPRLYYSVPPTNPTVYTTVANTNSYPGAYQPHQVPQYQPHQVPAPVAYQAPPLAQPVTHSLAPSAPLM